jgi:hypothetical protein
MESFHSFIESPLGLLWRVLIPLLTVFWPIYGEFSFSYRQFFRSFRESFHFKLRFVGLIIRRLKLRFVALIIRHFKLRFVGLTIRHFELGLA